VSQHEAVLRRQARRLVRWYPREWRARYGDEFTELLVADLDERPHAPLRTFDVAVSGATARLAAAGVAGRTLDPETQPARSLASAGGGALLFVLAAVALWSQLTIGWQWAPPEARATAWAMYVMSVGLLTLVALLAAAVVPVLATALARVVTGRGRGLAGPFLALVAGGAFLVVGAHHFANGWPGTGGHPWPDRGVVPGGVAAFAWASSLSVTSYWMHPGALAAFPPAEVAWMVLSPLTLIVVGLATTRLLRRLRVSPRLVRYERRLSGVAALAMATFLTGAALWVFDGGPGPHELFHVGAIDVVELVAMLAGMGLVAQTMRTGTMGPRRALSS
jgi:hypothetical protein